jgi:hypothetical protein
VLDAIVVHELCHIEEHNHSDAFWSLLLERFPRHDEASDWLKDHGPSLRFTRPSSNSQSLLGGESIDRPAPRFVRGTSSAASSQQSLF